MKKQLLSFMVLLFSGFSFSQEIWSENFDASTSLPTGWAQYNVDGLTPNSNITFMGTNAWVVRPKTTGGTDNHVASTSWYTPAGISNDWLVTPSISIPATGVYALEFDAIAIDANYPDGFKVYVSTTGNQVADFTTAALTVAAGPSTYTTQQINLSQWAGQTVYIAVQNNSNDKFLLYVDNFKVRMLQADDAILQSSKLTRYSLVNNNNNLVLTVKNDGYTTINNLTVNWNDGTDHSDVITTSIASGATATVTHPIPVSYATVVEKSIDVTITNVNGNADVNPDNNVNSDILFNTVSQQLVKKVLIEEGTGTWCGWCPRGAVSMDYMKATYPDNFIGVAVHNGDPMTVAEYDNGANFSGFPGCNVDRVMLDQSVSQTALVNYFNARKNLVVPASVAIQMTSANAGDLTFEVTSIFKTVYAAADLRLGVIIIEDDVTGTASGYNQTNYYANNAAGVMGGFEALANPVPAADMHYNHVGRALLGGYSGLAGSVSASITDGMVETEQFTYTVPSTSNIANMYAVAVLVDQTNGEVLNADKIWLSKAGLNNLNLNNYFSVYPNPATDILTVDFEATNNDDYAVSILDLQGRVVSSQNLSALNGAQKVTFDVNNLAKGSYVVTVSSNGMTSTKNVVIK
jgi:hypothetical protein